MAPIKILYGWMTLAHSTSPYPYPPAPRMGSCWTLLNVNKKTSSGLNLQVRHPDTYYKQASILFINIFILLFIYHNLDPSYWNPF